MVREEKVANADGLELYVRSWLPEAPPRAIVGVVPGFNSHGGYYTWVAEQLLSLGFAVYVVDLRGRGLSEGERFYVQSFEQYASDVHTMLQLARARDPGVPIYLLGHSAGGVVACLYTLEHQAELAGLICESFAHELPAPDVALALLKGLSHIAPHLHVLRLKNEDFSRDPQVLAGMNSDPLIARETQPSQTVAALVRSDEDLKREFPRIQLPLLILHGSLDKATNPSGSQHFYDQASSSDKTLKLYAGHYHDLLNDTGKEEVMADIKGWLTARLAA